MSLTGVCFEENRSFFHLLQTAAHFVVDVTMVTTHVYQLRALNSSLFHLMITLIKLCAQKLVDTPVMQCNALETVCQLLEVILDRIRRTQECILVCPTAQACAYADL